MSWKGNKMLEIYLAMLDSEEDKNMLEQLYANYKQFMYKTAYTILKNATDAEDAVHEAFMRVTRCMYKVDKVDSEKTKSYLCIITKNAAIDIYNEKIKVKTTDDENLEDAGTDVFDDSILGNYNFQLIVEQLKLLPPPIQRCPDAYYSGIWNGRSGKCSAHQYRCSVQTIIKSAKRV